MFSGIIEEVGKVIDKENTNGGFQLKFSASSDFLVNIKLGDSIAVNGVCLTVNAFDKSGFCADLSFETIDKTTFNIINLNDIVNLEKSLTLSKAINGHLVSGHIDTTATIKNKIKLGDNYKFEISINSSFNKYIAVKGSISVNGVSLTVNSINNNIFSVNIVPYTLESTNLSILNIKDNVNIEIDIIARYLEKLL